MNGQHLTEEQIQVYLSGNPAPDAGIAQHLVACEQCSNRVAAYRLLFSELEDMDVPVLDFDVQALVIPQLTDPVKPPVVQYNNYPLVLIALGFILIPVLLFWKYVVSFIQTTPALFFYPLLIIPAMLAVIKCYHIYHEYQQKIKTLTMH